MPGPEGRDPGRTMLIIVGVVLVIGGIVLALAWAAGSGLGELASH